MAYMPYNTHTKETPEEFMSKFKAEFYENGDKIPVKEFLDSLDEKMRAKMFMSIRLVEENGNQLRLPYS